MTSCTTMLHLLNNAVTLKYLDLLSKFKIIEHMYQACACMSTNILYAALHMQAAGRGLLNTQILSTVILVDTQCQTNLGNNALYLLVTVGNSTTTLDIESLFLAGI